MLQREIWYPCHCFNW